MYPWNSAIHHCVTSILIKEISVECPALAYDCVANHGLVEFVVSELSNVDQKNKVGYLGFLQCICSALEKRRLNLGCPFLCLYERGNHQPSLISSIEKWIDFYSLLFSK